MDEQILTSSQRHMLAWHLATLKAQVRFLSELLNIPNLEAQQETPASAEMKPSSLAIAPTADGQSGSSTSFEWSCPAKAATGEPAITATVTFPVPNLLLTVGDLQRLVQEGNWIRLSPMTSEQLSRFGATPSTTPVEEVGGPSAGGAEPSPDSPASSPEPAQGGSEGWPHCKASGWVDSDEFNSLLVQCDQKPGHVGDHYDSTAGRAFSSRTMKEGSERG